MLLAPYAHFHIIPKYWVTEWPPIGKYIPTSWEYLSDRAISDRCLLLLCFFSKITLHMYSTISTIYKYITNLFHNCDIF